MALSLDYNIFKENENYFIKETKEYGKLVTSKLDRDIGEVIINVKEPTCFGIHSYLLNRYCYNCFKISPIIKYKIQCKNCQKVYFCSNECYDMVMSSSSSSNKSTTTTTTTHIHTNLECLILSMLSIKNNLKSNTIHDQTEDRMIINYFSKIAYPSFKNLEIEMNNLIGNFKNESSSSLKKETIKDIKYRSIAIKKLFNLFFYDINLEDIENVYMKSQKNGFGLWKNSEQSFGISIYSNNDISFLNHSCFPNCIRIQNNQSISIISLIPIKKGDELNISYIDIRNSTNYRLNQLKEFYNFNCNCKRCSSDSSDSSDDFEKIILNYSCKNKLIKCSGNLYLSITNNNNNKIRICNYCKWEEKEEEIQLNISLD